jgi:hypothetical protein
LLAYKNLWIEHPRENVDTTIRLIRNNSQQNILDDDTIALTKLAFKYGKEPVINVLTLRQPNDSVADLMGRIEDILIEKK